MGRPATSLVAPAAPGSSRHHGLQRRYAVSSGLGVARGPALLVPGGGRMTSTSMLRARNTIVVPFAHSDIPAASGLMDPANDRDSCGESPGHHLGPVKGGCKERG